MAAFRHLSIFRRSFSTSGLLRRPALSAGYKSKQLWEDRFSCDLLSSDSDLIQVINHKITSGVDLNNLEIDVFINIAAPRHQDIAQLQESVTILERLRKSIHANTLLPSTAHALCRLFLDSGQLDSLIHLLEQRIKYGIFPDAFSMNLLFEYALEQGRLSIASRLAALIMLQEEFGLNQINDNFALYSVGKYIESKTDFSDWNTYSEASDPIFSGLSGSQELPDQTKKGEEKDAKQEQQEEVDEEDEEDAEYIRIPFLRNPYFDGHFDLTNPRSICGKTLKMLGHFYSDKNHDQKLGIKCMLIGNILQGQWSGAIKAVDQSVKSKITFDTQTPEVLTHYVENLHKIESAPSESEKQSLLEGFQLLPKSGLSISEEADTRHQELRQFESDDIERFKAILREWSEARHLVKKTQKEIDERKLLIEKIKAKKRELKEREQYLYFYDNLKKSHLTQINYE